MILNRFATSATSMAAINDRFNCFDSEFVGGRGKVYCSKVSMKWVAIHLGSVEGYGSHGSETDITLWVSDLRG